MKRCIGSKKVTEKKKWRRLQLQQNDHEHHEGGGGDDNDDGNGASTSPQVQLQATVPNSAAVKVMHQELILKKISSALPAAGLRNLRQTCQLWNHVFIPDFRKKHAPIQQLSNAKSTIYRQTGKRRYCKVNLRKMSDFSKVVRTSTELPFASYDLWLDLWTLKDCPHLQEFLQLCGTSARRVIIRDVLIQGARRLNLDIIRELLFDKLVNLTALELHLNDSPPISDKNELANPIPKLEQLTLGFGCFDLRLPHHTEAFLVDLIRGLLGLKTLALKTGVRLLLPIFQDFFPQAQLANLTKLELAKPLELAEMAILNEMSGRSPNPLRLNAFLLAISLRDVEPEFVNQLHTFLASQSGTLRLLELNTRPIRERWRSELAQGMIMFPIPRMECLREFRLIRRGQDRRRFLRFDESTMNDNFPALQKFLYDNKCVVHENLRIQYETWEIDDLFDMGILGHQSVSILELVISLPRAIDELYTLSRLGIGFPSITNLLVSASVRTLSGSLTTLWTAWPALESATIKYRYQNDCYRGIIIRAHLDQALSGVMTPFTRRLSRKLSASSLDEIRALHAKYKNRPGISDKKKLQSLTLDFTEAANCAPKLGDAGGYFGLAMAPQTLDHFSVVQHQGRANSRSGFGNFSKQCEAMIKHALGPDVQLHF